MSKTYKITTFISDSPKWIKYSKNLANRKIRRSKMFKGKGSKLSKKIYSSWDIRDYKETLYSKNDVDYAEKTYNERCKVKIKKDTKIYKEKLFSRDTIRKK